jgi:hypothetical protein
MYKLYKTTFGENAIIKTNEDGSTSSFVLGLNNPEEQAYLAWVADGNQPILAEDIV